MASRNPVKPEPGRGVVLERQHHLEQRMPRQRPRRVEHLDKTLKRHILMAVRRKIVRAHPQQKFTEARVARRVGAKHQRVDEEPNQIVQRNIRAPRDRRADRDVRAAAQPAQQRRQTRLQHHEQARPALLRKLQQPAMQIRRQRHRDGIPPVARNRRTRPVGRQIELVRQTFKPIAPVRQLPRQRARGIPLIPQNTLLPQRVVGVLHRQRRQLRRAGPQAAPRRTPQGPATAETKTSRRPRCGATAAAARARPRPRHSRPAHKAAPEAAAQTQDRTPAATPRQRLRKRSLAHPLNRKRDARRRRQPGSPAAAHPAAPGTACADSRGAPPHRSAPLQAPSGPAHRSAEPQTGSCRSRPQPSPPDGPGTTAGAAHTTAGSRRPRHRPQRRPRRRSSTQLPRQTRNARRLKQRPDREARHQGWPEPG